MTRAFASDYREKNSGYPDPYPVHKLKRVDRPTTVINDDEVSRKDERDGGFHRSVNWMVRNMPFTRKAIIKADDIMGYGKEKKEWKWWLDVEEVEGVLKEK